MTEKNPEQAKYQWLEELMRPHSQAVELPDPEHQPSQSNADLFTTWFNNQHNN